MCVRPAGMYGYVYTHIPLKYMEISVDLYGYSKRYGLIHIVSVSEYYSPTFLLMKMFSNSARNEILVPFSSPGVQC